MSEVLTVSDAGISGNDPYLAGMFHLLPRTPFGHTVMFFYRSPDGTLWTYAPRAGAKWQSRRERIIECC